MSRITATAKELRRSAAKLCSDARRLGDASSRLLLFYGVECKMKERYLVEQLSDRHGDTSAIEDDSRRPFGSTGHDLEAACKALRAPATLPPVPHLVIRGQAKSVEYAHQAWRYGIACSGSERVEEWLAALARWLEDDR